MYGTWFASRLQDDWRRMWKEYAQNKILFQLPYSW